MASEKTAVERILLILITSISLPFDSIRAGLKAEVAALRRILD
jgi:hypothetical protein